MKRCKQTLYNIFNPSLNIILWNTFLTVALMIYIFLLNENTDSFFAYVSYFISAYSTVTACIRIGRYLKYKFFALAKNNRYLYHYITDIVFRAHISLYQSLAINLMYVGLNLGSGIYYHSFWSGTLAVYYFFLAIMRFLLLRHVNKNVVGKDIVSEFRKYRFCGLILLLMNTALSGIVILVIHQNGGFQYAGSFIYIMAVYAFYSIIMAIVNVLKFRKKGSPILSASKAINLVVAIVSMYSLEIAMLSRFHNDTSDNPVSKHLMIEVTGIIICVLVFGISIFMIIRSTRALQKGARVK